MATLKEFLKNNSNMLEFEVKQTFNENAAGKTDRVIILKVPEPILTDKEKEYLSNVIKPFRNKVIIISKLDYKDRNEYEYVCIEHVEVYNDISFIILPCFKKGTMYKGMKADKEYSLEELGL